MTKVIIQDKGSCQFAMIKLFTLNPSNHKYLHQNLAVTHVQHKTFIVEVPVLCSILRGMTLVT